MSDYLSGPKGDRLVRRLYLSSGILALAALHFPVTSPLDSLDLFWQVIGRPIGGSLCFAAVLSMSLPALGFVGYRLAKVIHYNASNLLQPMLPCMFEQGKKSLAARVRLSLRQKFPFQTAYLGFLMFCLIVPWLPLGVGTAMLTWLQNCLIAANMVLPGAPAHPLLAISVNLWITLGIFFAIDPFAVKVSAGYQAFLTNLIEKNAGDGLLKALYQTIRTPIKSFDMPSKHPQLRCFVESAIYISSCYLFLFWLAAFSPFTTIRGWLDDSVLEAGLPSAALSHANLQIFMASIVAAFGTVPFAVMSCAFLPPRRSSACILTEHGMLFPHRVFRPQMQFWSSLRRVSAANPGQADEEICLHFRNEKLSFKTSQQGIEKISELLSAIDEYTPQCIFDPCAVRLRKTFSEDNLLSSLTETKKFESTVFRPGGPGDLLQQGDYRIVRKLASKPLSAMYLARRADGVRVVIRHFIMSQDTGETSAQKELFRREYCILSKLQHPLIVKVLDTFEEDKNSYIVLEHIDGEDLRSLSEKRGPRKDNIVIDWAIDICQQLCYLHAIDEPILHRDLTPDNLILDENGRIRIIDFGCANRLLEGVTGTLIGKQSYIAPEQLRGKPSLKSDIYSFGASLFFLLVGHDPTALQQSDPAETGVRVREDLNQLVRQCTEFDEHSRPDSFEVILKRLKAMRNNGGK